MNTELIAMALLWGLISGYLLSRTAASVTGLGFCLHALVTARWTYLSGKASVNQVDPGTVLRLMGRIALLVGLLGYLLFSGYEFTRRSGLDYDGSSGIVYFAVLGATLLFLIPGTRRKVTFYWRMSHEFDYAQRRERTWMLKR